MGLVCTPINSPLGGQGSRIASSRLHRVQASLGKTMYQKQNKIGGGQFREGRVLTFFKYAKDTHLF